MQRRRPDPTARPSEARQREPSGSSTGIGRRRLLVSGGVLGSTLLAGCIGGSSGSAGEDATEDSLVLPSLDVAGSPGGEVALRPRGKAVLLDFFATWCAPCKPEMSNLRAARAEFDPATVHMVSITQETDEEAIRAFWREYEGTWPVAMDPDLAATTRYDVTSLPTIVVLAPDGSRVMRHVGLAGKDRIVAAIEDALDREGT